MGGQIWSRENFSNLTYRKFARMLPDIAKCATLKIENSKPECEVRISVADGKNSEVLAYLLLLRRIFYIPVKGYTNLNLKHVKCDIKLKAMCL